jgi:hypothetical protein
MKGKKFDLVPFDTSFRTYRTSGALLRDENTIGYHIVNTGNCIAFVNNFPLYPSGVLDTLYSGYQDFSLYNVKFEVGGGSPEVTVITFNKRF